MISEYFHVQIGTATSLGIIISLLGVRGILESKIATDFTVRISLASAVNQHDND